MYPNNNQSADFPTNKFSKFYNSYASLCREMGSQCAMSMKDYKNIYTVFGFDTSAQPVKPSNSSMNIKIKIKRSAVGAAVIAQLDYYVIIFYDKVIRLFPQEKKVTDTY